MKSLLARDPHKICLYQVFAPTSHITNDVMSLLNPMSTIIYPLNSNNDQISTGITDEFLIFPVFKEYSVTLRGFLNLHLTFPAIMRLFTNEYIYGYHYLCIGTIGYQEMPAVLHYYQSGAWTEWGLTLCNINNSSYLEFDDIFSNQERKRPRHTFGVSIDRDSNGIVDNAVVPEELVDRKTVERFKRLVKALDSNTPVESVESKKIDLCNLSLDLWEQNSHSYLEIEGSICHQPNARDESSQAIEIVKPNVDQSSAEDILVKIFKLCSSIESLTLRAYKNRKNESLIKMTDRLFASLLEHAVATEVREEWSMDLQLLSAENLVRLCENKTAGLFKNLKIEATSERNTSHKK